MVSLLSMDVMVSWPRPVMMVLDEFWLVMVSLPWCEMMVV